MSRDPVRQDGPSTRSAPQGAAQRRVAAIHRQGREWRVLVARADSASVDVIAAKSFPEAEAAGIAALLREHRVDRVIRVLSASQTICRRADVAQAGGGAGGAELAGALALLAEADLPSSIPAHRRAGGVLSLGSGSSPAIALLVGWPVAAADSAPFPVDLDADEFAFVPEPVALACLAAAQAPVGGGGVQTAAYADPSTGSMTILAAGPERSLPRILRADNTSPAAWTGAFARALAETRAGAGLPPDATVPRQLADSPTLLLLGTDSAVAGPRITGASSDAAWRSSFGMALGAILAWASPDPALAPLLRLRAGPPGRSGSRVVHAITWLSTTRRAVAVLAACIAVVLFWPLGVAAARNWTLQSRAGGADTAQQRLDAADKQAAFYNLLRARRWPMTKLLADIASAAPVGVTIEFINLSPEQGAVGGVSLRGTADSRDHIATFRKNLSDTRVFDDVATPTIAESSAGSSGRGEGVEFMLQARVAGALMKTAPIDDFAKEPLAVRLYGEDGRRAVANSSGGGSGRSRDRDRESSSDSARNNRNNNNNNNNGRRTNRTTPAAPEAAKPGAIPPPISDADIAKLDRESASREFRSRSMAANIAGLEEATKQRLKDEAAKAKQRMIQATNEKPA